MTKNVKYILGAVVGLLILGLSVYGAFLYNVDDTIVISKQALIDHVNKDASRMPNFVGFVIIYADIQTNTRQLAHMYIVDPDVKRLYDDYFSTRIINDKRPLFIHNKDEINSRTVRLINHEFICEEYKKTNGYLFAPTDKISTVCSVAVPVSQPYFNGYISILMSKEPTSTQKDIAEIMIRDISDDVSSMLARH